MPPSSQRQRSGWIEPLPFLGIGLVTAPLIGVLPMLGWFFGALCHEIGHATTAWFLGRPAIPRISPAGIAVTTHQDPILFFVLVVPALIGVALWRALAPLGRMLTLGPLAVLLAFGHLGGGEALLLLGGHLGELAIAATFLVRAWTGGWTHSAAERALHASCAFFLVGANLKLTLGLATSEAARAWYRGPGAGACENDYVRLGWHWNWSLEQVANMMSAAAILSVPLALGVALLLRPPAPPARNLAKLGATTPS